MRPVLAAALAFSLLTVADAQSGAPLHHAGRVVKNRYHAVGHHYRATKHYLGHKYRGVKKAIKN